VRDLAQGPARGTSRSAGTDIEAPGTARSPRARLDGVVRAGDGASSRTDREE
jgi:hypothetical protein